MNHPLYSHYIWVYMFFTILGQNWWQDQKNKSFPPVRCISVAIFYLLWPLSRMWNFFGKPSFQFCLYCYCKIKIISRRYCRSSRPEVFYKKGVLRNLIKFTGKHLCQSLFFIKETLAQVFSCEFCQISKITIFTQNTSGGCFCYWYENISIATYSTSFYCHRGNNSTANFINFSIVLKGISPPNFILFRI